MQDGFVTLTEARRRLDVSGLSLRRAIAAGELPVYTNPRDRRSRLIALGDLERFATPRRLSPAPNRTNAGELQGVA